MLIIRAATAEDGARVAQVYVESWNAGFGELMPAAVLDDGRVARWTQTVADGNWWVAEVDGVVAGVVGIGASRDPVDPELGELDTIAVDPAYWRSGVGTALMDKALEELAGRFDQAILWTLADYPQGQTFYVKTGWTLTNQTRDNGHQVCYHRSFR